MDTPPLFSLPLGEDLLLRQLEAGDAMALFHLIDSCRPYLRAWLPWVNDCRTPAETHFFVALAIQQFIDNDGLYVGLWQGNALAGMICYPAIDWPNRMTSLGYYLGESFQGQGLMTRACQAMVAYAFETLEMHRVEIRCAPGNTKSRAIAERLGFTLEGRLRQAACINGDYTDLDLYSKLLPDHRAETRHAGSARAYW